MTKRTNLNKKREMKERKRVWEKYTGGGKKERRKRMEGKKLRKRSLGSQNKELLLKQIIMNCCLFVLATYRAHACIQRASAE